MDVSCRTLSFSQFQSCPPLRAPWLRYPPPPCPPPLVHPLCDIPSGCCMFTGPSTVTRSSLRMLRRVAAFCQPLRPVHLLVSFPRLGSPVVGKRTYGGRPGQRVEEQGTRASRTQKHSEAGYGRPVDRGVWTGKTVKRPQQQPAHPQYTNYWALLTRKRHTMPHSAQPQHTLVCPYGLPLLLRKQPIWAAGDTPHLMPVEQGLPWHPVATGLAGQANPFIVAASHAHAPPSAPSWFPVPAVLFASPALLCPSSLFAVLALVPPGLAPAFCMSMLLLPLSVGAPGCPCRAPTPVPPACPPRTRVSHLRTTWTVPCAVDWARPCCHPRGGHLPARGA